MPGIAVASLPHPAGVEGRHPPVALRPGRRHLAGPDEVVLTASRLPVAGALAGRIDAGVDEVTAALQRRPPGGPTPGALGPLRREQRQGVLPQPALAPDLAVRRGDRLRLPRLLHVVP